MVVRGLSENDKKTIALIYKKINALNAFNIRKNVVSSITGVLFKHLFEPRVEDKDILHLLDSLAKADISVIPDIFPLVFLNRKKIAVRAAEIINGLFHNMQSEDYKYIDERMRYCSYGLGYSAYYDFWRALHPKSIVNINDFGEYAVPLFSIISFHPNGYIREAAINLLAQNKDGRELPALLIRLNDWVEPVRKAAKKACMSRLQSEYITFFIRNSMFLENLRHSFRGEHSEFLSAVKNLIWLNRGLEFFIKEIKKIPLKVQRYGCKMFLKHDPENISLLLGKTLSSTDALIRWYSVKWVFENKKELITDAFLEKIKKDTFMPIRCIYFSMKAHDEKELLDAIFDRHRSIRELARYALAKVRKVDFRQKYIEALSGDNIHVEVAIEGVSETGTKEDVQFVLPFLSARPNRLVKAAIKAISRLGGLDYIDLIFEKIKSEQPGISKQALKALYNKVSSNDIEKLMDMFHSSEANHIKKNIVSLISALNKWDSLPLLLECFASMGEEALDLSERYIGRWIQRFNKSMVKPNSVQESKVVKSIDRYLSCMPEKFRKEFLDISRSLSVYKS